MSGGLVIEVRELEYSYEDGSPALDGISLDVSSGEIVAVLGPNGAGKSTLLRLLAGLLDPKKGSVQVDGIDIHGKKGDEARRKVGLLFQDPDDQIFMPRVWDDVAFGPINLRLEKDEVERRVEEAMSLAGLTGYEDRVPHHLSFGEKKRVAIAGVLAMKPDILLLDEPTANLDPRGRRELVETVKGLGCTIIIATHDLEAASLVADRAYILSREIIGEGTIDELMADKCLMERADLI